LQEAQQEIFLWIKLNLLGNQFNRCFEAFKRSYVFSYKNVFTGATSRKLSNILIDVINKKRKNWQNLMEVAEGALFKETF
jgi:hypothetical protein